MSMTSCPGRWKRQSAPPRAQNKIYDEMDVVMQRVVGAALAGSSLYEVVLETSEEFKQWLEKEVGMTSADLGGSRIFAKQRLL